MPEELTLGQLAYVAVLLVLYLGIGVTIGRYLRWRSSDREVS